jgi:hypothetical protein
MAIDMLSSVKTSACSAAALAMILATGITMPGCRKEEQAVSKVATNAAAAERQAQAASLKREEERSQLAKIALPTKSRYVDVHEPGAWMNPFISFDTRMVNVRVTQADANPSDIGKGGILRPTSARRQEIQIHQEDLVDALIALPPGAWPYGRVVAIEESPLADKRQRPAIRRQIELAIRQLNDLGVVVEDWPER